MFCLFRVGRIQIVSDSGVCAEIDDVREVVILAFRHHVDGEIDFALLRHHFQCNALDFADNADQFRRFIYQFHRFLFEVACHSNALGCMLGCRELIDLLVKVVDVFVYRVFKYIHFVGLTVFFVDFIFDFAPSGFQFA